MRQLLITHLAQTNFTDFQKLISILELETEKFILFKMVTAEQDV